MSKSLYIHIPFCQHICSYCDFFRVKVNPLLIKQYIEQLILDINKIQDDISTIYLGGGTPSALTKEEIEPLLKALSQFSVSEYTIECNPESLDEDKIVFYKSYGINRISLGVQSSNDYLLQTIGRKHDFNHVKNVINLLKKHGLSNISIDLIYGLPQQSINDLKLDLDNFLNLNINHVSLYSLTIEKNSEFGRQGILPATSELETQMYQLICKTLENCGYEHYEIANFAKPGFQSQHNLTYWNYHDFIGLGCHASGKENHKRYTNQPNIKNYLDGQRNKQELINLSTTDEMFEMVMMGLRLRCGVDKTLFKKRFNLSVDEVFKEAIEANQIYFIQDKKYLRLNENGRLILMDILLDFMD